MKANKLATLAVALLSVVLLSSCQTSAIGSNLGKLGPLGRIELIRSFNVQLERGPLLERQLAIESAITGAFPAHRWYIVHPGETVDIRCLLVDMDGPGMETIIVEEKGLVYVDVADLPNLTQQELRMGMAIAIGEAAGLDVTNIPAAIFDEDIQE